MSKPTIPVGLVFSQSGPYQMMASEMLKGALMAIAEVNLSDAFDFELMPHLVAPHCQHGHEKGRLVQLIVRDRQVGFQASLGDDCRHDRAGKGQFCDRAARTWPQGRDRRNRAGGRDLQGQRGIEELADLELEAVAIAG